MGLKLKEIAVYGILGMGIGVLLNTLPYNPVEALRRRITGEQATETIKYTMRNGQKYTLIIPESAEVPLRNFLSENEGKDMTYVLKAMDVLDQHLDAHATEDNIEKVIHAIALKNAKGCKIGDVPASEAYKEVWQVLGER